MTRLLLALLLSLALAPLWGTGAFAHAQLIAAEPADGAVLAVAPERLRLRFNEPVAPLVVRLIAPDGRAVEGVAAEGRGESVEVGLPQRATLGPGTYALSWRVVSADGHPIGGTVLFSIGATSAAPAGAAEPVDQGLRIALWLTRVLVYAGLFVGIGGAAFVAFFGLSAGAAPPARGAIASALVLGLPATMLGLGLQGADALGAPLAGLLDSAVWRAGFATANGPTAALALAALLSGLASLLLRRPLAQRTLALAGLALLGAALAWSGHASAAPPQWLTRPAVFAHAVGVALWVGVLLPLAALLARGGEAARGATLALSRLLLPVVALLTIAGVALAVVQVETPEALVTTAYGQVLLAKLALLGLLFALAAWNRYRLTPALARGDAGAEGRFRRSALAEAALALSIFGVAAFWRFTPPPRALAAAAEAPASVHIHTLPAMVDLTLTPGRARLPLRASLALATGEFGPLEVKEVTLTLANPAAGIEPIARRAARQADGTWAVEGLVVPVPGRWAVRVNVLVTDFDKHILEDAVEVRP